MSHELAQLAVVESTRSMVARVRKEYVRREEGERNKCKFTLAGISSTWTWKKRSKGKQRENKNTKETNEMVLTEISSCAFNGWQATLEPNITTTVKSVIIIIVIVNVTGTIFSKVTLETGGIFVYETSVNYKLV